MHAYRSSPKLAGTERALAPAPVPQVLPSPLRTRMENGFGHDFGRVQIQRNEVAARGQAAVAYAAGERVVIDGERLGAQAGEHGLLAHELAHVVQQRGGTGAGRADAARLERQADLAADALRRNRPLPRLSAAPAGMQRKVSVRDVGRGEQSGMSRVGEFLARLNEVSTGLDFSLEGAFLVAKPRLGGTLSEFDRQMQACIIDGADIPMIMTNRKGAMGTRELGFRWLVQVDDWRSGYVDIDDLLASSPTGFMTALVHLLRERQQTSGYKRRLGSQSLNSDGAGEADFNRAHEAGVDAELALLRDVLQDPGLRFANRGARVLISTRGDRIRERMSTTGQRGIHDVRWEVVLHDGGRVMSIEDYAELLKRERAAPAAPAAAAPAP